MISQEACRNRPKSVAAMKAIVSRKWNALDPAKIRAACCCFRPRWSDVLPKKAAISVKIKFKKIIKHKLSF